MCTGLEIAGLLLGLGGTAASLMQQPATPPKAETPAAPAPTSRAPGATVRLGNSDDDILNTTTNDPSRKTFTEKRTSGNALGNLGRSSLAL